MTPSDHDVVTESIREYAGSPTRQLTVDGAGPTVVLLHGVYDRAETWSGVLGRLAAAGRRAVAVDLPPVHLLPSGPILPQLDSIVAAVIESHAGSEGVVLSGNSMGAGLTLRAAANPELPVLAAIPFDVPGFGYRPWTSVAVGRYALPPTVLARLSLPAGLYRTRFGPWFIARMAYARGGAATAADAQHFLDLFGATGRVGALAVAGRALLREFDAGYPPGPLPPTLIVHGRKDMLITPAAAYRAARHYPTAKVRILPASAHCPQVDDPDTATRLILECAQQAHHAA